MRNSENKISITNKYSHQYIDEMGPMLKFFFSILLAIKMSKFLVDFYFTGQTIEQNLVDLSYPVAKSMNNFLI